MSLLNVFGIGSKKRRIQTMTVEQAHKCVQAGAFVLVDVRRLDEWNETGRPQGSVGVTLQDAAYEQKIARHLAGNKEKAVALICRSGARSMQGAEKLRANGFSNITNVTGGFMAWAKQDLPIDHPPFEDD